MTFGWFATHLDGTVKDPLTTARDRRASWALSGPADASVTLSADGPNDQTTLIEELRTDLLVTWNGTGLSRYRFGGSVGEITETSHSEVFGAVDYRGVLDGRKALVPLAYDGADIGEAAWNLVAYTQWEAPYPGGPLGIGRGDFTPIATADVDVPSGKNIGEAIDDLGGRYPGFDWWLDAGLQMHLRPQRGGSRDFPLSLIRGGGGTCTRVQPTLDTAQYGNLIHQTGADGLAPAVRAATDLASRPEGRWERQEANPDLTTQAAVNASADMALARAMTLAPSWTFTLKAGVWTPDDLWIGDYTPIIVRSGRHDISTTERVTGISITDDGNGTVVPEITVSNRLAQDVNAMLAKALRR